mmetsp:Transcript_915/g.1164  ORF Transcript_915/g.1164 Transcript_915/m.1164 type:complete len:93 (-) Transcript_915:890-1168(-)
MMVGLILSCCQHWYKFKPLAHSLFHYKHKTTPYISPSSHVYSFFFIYVHKEESYPYSSNRHDTNPLIPPNTWDTMHPFLYVIYNAFHRSIFA